MSAYEHLGREELYRLLKGLAESEGPAATPEQNIVRELAAHQIELELQNRDLQDAQQAIESSRNGYLELYDFAPVALFTFDLRGVVTEVNLAGTQLLKRSRDRVLAHPLIALVRLREPARFWAHLSAARASKRPVSHELEFEVSGQRVCVEAVSTAIANAQAEVTGYRTAFRDMTERKRIEEREAELHELERRMRARFEALDEASYSISRALSAGGRIDLEQVLSHMAHQVAGMPGCLGAVLTVDRSPGVASLSVAVDAKTDVPSFAVEIPVMIANRRLGTLRVARAEHMTLTHDERRTLEMLAERAASAIEIASIAAKQEREAQHLVALDHITQSLMGVASLGDALAALRLVSSYLVPNHFHACLAYVAEPSGSLRLLRVCLADGASERYVESLHHPERGAEAVSPLLAVAMQDRRAVLSDSLRNLLAWNDEADASRFEVGHLLVVPLLARERVAGVLCFGKGPDEMDFDVEDMRWAEQIAVRCAHALDSGSLLDQLRAAVDVRDNLLDTVSHDLRSPLNAISLSASALEGTPRFEERRRTHKQVELIKRSASRMTHLVSDLLLASNVETGRLRVELRTESAADLLRDAHDTAEAQAAAKRLSFECESGLGLPSVRADRERISQVFSNLIANAVKFTPEGGKIKMGAQRRGSSVEFFVTDTGPGIASHELPHVFERYWIGSQQEVVKRRGTGLGLGLCIVRGIVDAHAGTVSVESELGKGSTFRFVLPAAPD